jgi:hypothetical protein
MRKSGNGAAPVSLCLRIVHEPAGSWSVHGIANRPVAHLPSLAASLDYARRECAEAAATLELLIDGFYAVVHQEAGWPRQLLRPYPETADFAQAELAARRRHD